MSLRLAMTALAALAGLFVAAPSLGVPPCRYTVEHSAPIDCVVLGISAAFYPQDVNDSGVACGYWRCPVGGLEQAFVWDKARGMRPPALPPGTHSSVAHSISNSGVVRGSYSSPQGGGLFVSDGDIVTTWPLPIPAGSMTDANDSGRVAGTWNPVPGVFAPFRWLPGDPIEDLAPLLGRNIGQAYGEAISADGTVCGYYNPDSSSEQTRGFLIGPGNAVTVVPPLEPYTSSRLYAINDQNAAAGISLLSGPGAPRQAFIVDHGVSTPLPPYPYLLPPGVELYSVPESINNDKVVVGFWVLGPSFVYHGGQIEQLSVLVGESIQAPEHLHVNNVGQIAGRASLPNPGGPDVVFVATPVPAVAGDTNCDEVVNVDDLLAVINHWNEAGVRADVNEDGIVNQLDLLDVIRYWTVGGS